MYKLILSRKGYLKVERYKNYSDAINAAKVLVSKLEDTFGEFERKVLMCNPAPYQLCAENYNSRHKIAIEAPEEYSSTFTISQSGDILHRPSNIVFIGLKSNLSYAELSFHIKRDKYHCIQPSMK